MTRNEIFYYSVLIALLITGFFLDGFVGGLLSGSSFMLIVLVSIGKKQAKKAAEKMEKRINEIKREAEIW
jgi:uncharacterized protein YjgD (DUF1641 family)